MDCSPPDSSVLGILQAGVLSGLPLPSLGDITDPGIEPRYPALQADSLPSETAGGLVLKRFILYHKFFSIIISFADTSFYNESLGFHLF